MKYIFSTKNSGTSCKFLIEALMEEAEPVPTEEEG